ncbi:MAG: hypothetical protein KKF56_01735 [Nanoarchaeota archaeon]|nr:hypothetical protein [Nanoarchaeota archaeon]
MRSKRVVEVSKGGLKGLAGGLCILPMGMGLPAADGLYQSIKTRAGRVAYNVACGTLLTSALAAIYSLSC